MECCDMDEICDGCWDEFPIDKIEYYDGEGWYCKYCYLKLHPKRKGGK